MNHKSIFHGEFDIEAYLGIMPIREHMISP